MGAAKILSGLEDGFPPAWRLRRKRDFLIGLSAAGAGDLPKIDTRMSEKGERCRPRFGIEEAAPFMGALACEDFSFAQRALSAASEFFGRCSGPWRLSPRR